MTISADSSAVQTTYFDPYDVELNADPYPMFRRLREEQPLYYNDNTRLLRDQPVRGRRQRDRGPQDFHLQEGRDPRDHRGEHGDSSGTLIFENPPIHDIHRKLLARMFTPRKINALEPKIREYTGARSLDPLVGSGRFDFVKDFGAQMPMRVIGKLLGIPEEDQEAIRDRSKTKPCAPRPASR